MRGILEHEYGVPHKSVEWVAELDEDVDFTPPPDLKITRLPHDKSVEDMLAEGEVDALIHSDIIKPIEAGDPRVARLWPDYKAEEIRFYKKTQIFPIMHVMGIRQEIVDRHPWVPVNLFHAFEKSKAIAMRRMDNPRIVPLAWYLEAWNEQQEHPRPRPVGIRPEREEPAQREYDCWLLARTGADHAEMDRRRSVRQRVPGPQAWRRMANLTARLSSCGSGVHGAQRWGSSTEVVRASTHPYPFSSVFTDSASVFVAGGRLVDIVCNIAPCAVGRRSILYARVLACYMSKHNPGNPLIVPQNMTGAGSRPIH